MGPHGVQGQIRVRSSTENPASLFEYGNLTDKSGNKTFALTKRGQSKGDFIASIKDVDDRNAAEALKGTELYIDREMLPNDLAENEFYLNDLVDLNVRQDNETLGTVIDVHDYGAGLFLEIKPTNGKSFMLPFKDEFVPIVDVDAGFIETKIPEDWLKDEKKP